MEASPPAVIFLSLLLCVVIVLSVLYCVLLKFPYCCDSEGCCNQEEEECNEQEDDEAALLKEVVIGDRTKGKEDNLNSDNVFISSTSPKPADKNRLQKGGGRILSKLKMKNRNGSTDKQELVRAFSTPSSIGGYGAVWNFSDRLNSSSSASVASFMSTTSIVDDVNSEHQFDPELTPLSIQILIAYDPVMSSLSVGVKQLDCVHCRTASSKSSRTIYWQVVIEVIRPSAEKNRFKTKYRTTNNPVFNRSFDIENVTESTLQKLLVWYRVYARRRTRTGRKRLAGEFEVDISESLHSSNNNTIFEWKEITNGFVTERLV